MPGPMTGLTVIEVGIWVQGPLAARLLADMGARVIKIEHPEFGDFSRGLTTLYGASMMTEDGRALLWELCNRGKESVGLDLRSPEGQEVLHSLVAQADVFLTNFQDDILQSFQCTPDDLLPTNERLIYARGGGLTINGELSSFPAQDTTAMAQSGFMLTAGSVDGAPVYPPGAITDISAATSLAFGTVSALLGRERNQATSRVVTTSLVQAMAWAQMLGVSVPANTGERLRAFEPGSYANPLMGVYRAGDGRWIALGVVSIGQHIWRTTCEALGTLDWFESTDWGESPKRRLAEAPAITRALEDVFASRPAEAWIERLREFDLPCSLVRHPAELVEDQGIQADRLIARARDGLAFLTGPFNMDAEGEGELSAAAPALGQDTWTVLAGMGCTQENIAAMFERGIAS